ncbi:MAG: SGNH/GDSL hydrolase family protein [Planctomycetes bacterium]|nr:SGNH/GDSL hydrolase family protein [Planctomycetota bacterium]
MSRRERFVLLRRLLLIGFGGVIGILLAETTLRFVGIADPSPYQPDRILGSRLKPDYAGWNTKENSVFFRTNRVGFRDREHAEAKPDDTIRIAVLGDSYCEALQVELNETFWAVCEQELNQCEATSGKKIEVLNTGVSGYGTAQELLMLRNELWQYEPDIVLLAFLTGNDVRNNSKELESDSLKPFFTLEGDTLVLDDSFTQQPFFTSFWIRLKDRLINSSRLLTLTYRIRHRDEFIAPASVNSGFEAGLDDFIYSEPKTPAQRDAWSITESLIDQMHSDVEARSAKLVIATLTNGIQVHPDPAIRDTFAASLGVADLGYADRRIATLADRLGCRSIILVDQMARYAQKHNVFLHGFEKTRLGTGHWNATGHRLAGEIIAMELCGDKDLWDR